MNKVIKEINIPFKTILAMYNAVVTEMNKRDYKVYDPQDANYYIAGATYNNDKDRLEIDWEDDK